MEESVIVVEQPAPGLAVVTLNRPHAMNALSARLRAQLAASIEALGSDAGVRVVIVTGAGKAFCAGLDLRELGADNSALLPSAPDNPAATIRNFPGVVIGAINGAAITGGLELAMACDILIASETARFADTHGRVGALPAWHLSQRLSRTIGLYRAKHMSLSGQAIGARQAGEWGLVSEVVPPERLMERAREIAQDILAAPSETIAALKSLIDDGYALPLGEALTLEATRAALHNGAVSPSAVAQRREGILQRGRAAK